MAALDSSSRSIGTRTLWSGPTDDREDTRLPGKRIEIGGKRRREVSGIRGQDVPDNTRGILDREQARRRRIACWKGWEKDGPHPFWRKITQGSLAKRTDPLALIRGVSEIVTFPDAKGDAYRITLNCASRMCYVN